MSKHASPVVVGAFVVTAFVLLFAGIMVFGGARYFHPRARVIVYFDGSVAGLRIGSPVKFRGIEIGTVKDLRINMTGAIRDPQNIRIPVLLQLDMEHLTAQGVAGADFRSRKGVARLVGLGLRAQLASESLIGGRFVALDIKPETPARLVHDPKYPEIPSLGGGVEDITVEANKVLAKVAEVDFASLAESAQKILDDTDRLLRSPDLARAVARLDEIANHVDGVALDARQTMSSLRPAVAGLKGAATSASSFLAPEGRLSYQVESTLREVQATVRSLRRLSDQLSRDPGAIVRGGKQ